MEVTLLTKQIGRLLPRRSKWLDLGSGFRQQRLLKDKVLGANFNKDPRLVNLLKKQKRNLNRDKRSLAPLPVVQALAWWTLSKVSQS